MCVCVGQGGHCESSFCSRGSVYLDLGERGQGWHEAKHSHTAKARKLLSVHTHTHTHEPL